MKDRCFSVSEDSVSVSGSHAMIEAPSRRRRPGQVEAGALGESETPKHRRGSRGKQTRYRDPQLTHWIAGRFTAEEKAFLENAVELAGPWRKPRRQPLGMFADAGRFTSPLQAPRPKLQAL